MTALTFGVPEAVLNALRLSSEQFGPALRLAAATHWYSHGRLSQEMAARVAGLSRARFLEELSRAKVDAFVVDFDDLERELRLG
jgi:predicted HTH domain antitoxin